MPTESFQFSWVAAPLYSFPAHLNGGDTLSVFSVVTGADINKQVTGRLEAGLSLTYIYDDYKFSGLGGFPPGPPSLEFDQHRRDFHSLDFLPH